MVLPAAAADGGDLSSSFSVAGKISWLDLLQPGGSSSATKNCLDGYFRVHADDVADGIEQTVEAMDILYGSHPRNHAAVIASCQLVPTILTTDDQQRIFLRADLADDAAHAKLIAGQLMDLDPDGLFSNERESLKAVPGVDDLWEPTPKGQTAGQLFWHLLVLNPEDEYFSDRRTPVGPFKQLVVYPEPPDPSPGT